MIHVDRNKVPKPGSLGTKAEEETEKAIAHYKDPDKKGKAFPFRIYKESDVKMALDRLFHGKCAYCESVFANVHPMDVEHWRPKGNIFRREGDQMIKVSETGYYWLAAEWTNLLPSCIDCNRKRHQFYIDSNSNASTLDDISSINAPIDENRAPDNPEFIAADEDTAYNNRLLGKESLFPVKDHKYSTNPETYAATPETALLLNPCEDEPKDFVEYVDEAVIRPLPTLVDDLRLKADNSIIIYGLNRSRLVYERKEHLLTIKARIYTIQQLIIALDRLDMRCTNAKKVAPILEDVIEHEMRELRRYRLSNKPYAQMARQVIDCFFSNL